MSRRPRVVATALLLALGLLATATAPTQAAGPVRIMPLGDSITGSPGCWRALLWNQLQAAGFTDKDDQLPDFFTNEPLPPHNLAWDFTTEEMQAAKV